jgi:hypothetical protein
MATEKQIAANRQNALKSTGPRSPAGKRRSSHNAYRHGLSVGLAPAIEARADVEALAKVIVDDLQISQEDASVIALTELDLQRIRRVKHAAIAMADASQGAPAPTDADQGAVSGDEARMARAMSLALPELRKLDRYERQAAALRHRTLRGIARDRTIPGK